MREPWMLLMHSEALKQLQVEGLRGLSGGPTELVFDQEPPTEVLELQIMTAGRLHPSSLPPDATECPKCGRLGASWPKKPTLEAASLPEHLDLFRLRTFPTMIIGTERIADALDRLGLAEEVVFCELPTR